MCKYYNYRDLNSASAQPVRFLLRLLIYIIRDHHRQSRQTLSRCLAVCLYWNLREAVTDLCSCTEYGIDSIVSVNHNGTDNGPVVS